MKKVLAIIGAGHLGQQIAHYAISDNHYKSVVFFDDFTSEKKVNGYLVLGGINAIEKEFAKHAFDEVLIGIGYKHIEKRKEVFKKFNGKIPFGRLIHSSCWVDSTAEVKKGCIIYPSCNVDANVVVKENTIVNIGCTIAHDTLVGKHCFLSPRVALAGFVTIEEQCVIGINSTVIDNIKIVSKTQLGAGTVVIKTISKKGLYVGNPQKFIR